MLLALLFMRAAGDIRGHALAKKDYWHEDKGRKQKKKSPFLGNPVRRGLFLTSTSLLEENRRVHTTCQVFIEAVREKKMVEDDIDCMIAVVI